MNIKKFFYEKTETITRRERGYIEMDTDFTQVYHSFCQIGLKLKSVYTFKLMHWLLANKANKQNGFNIDKKALEEFNLFLQSNDDSVTERTFRSCIEELKDNLIVTRVARGLYYFNPNFFWAGTKEARTSFIRDESIENKFKLKNGKDNRSETDNSTLKVSGGRKELGTGIQE